MSVAVEEDVLELDVAVDDVVLVELLERQHDLPDVDPHLVLRELLTLVQVREQLAPVHVVYVGGSSTLKWTLADFPAIT